MGLYKIEFRQSAERDIRKIASTTIDQSKYAGQGHVHQKFRLSAEQARPLHFISYPSLGVIVDLKKPRWGSLKE